MFTRRLLLLSATLFAAVVSTATGCAATTDDTEATDATETFLSQPQPISYDSVEGLSNAELKAGLYALVKDQHAIGYDRARKLMFTTTGFMSAGKVECQYTGILVNPNGTATPGGFNTEHTWPQSRGADREPAKSDLNHLFPVDGQTNSARGNHPFGDTTCLADGTRCTFQKGGSALGDDDSGHRVFEVRPERRGNVARAMFYFSVRYDKRIAADEETALRAWHEEDPVDDAELRRNDAVQTAQGNRNPFIDRPDFVERIADF